MVRLKAMQGVEIAHGRPAPGAEGRSGSRTIDIDILTYGDSRIDQKDLVVPHPRMHLRDFVLRPLADIEPEYSIPGVRKNVKQLLEQMHQEAAATVSSDHSKPEISEIRPFILTGAQGKSLFGRRA